MKVRSGLGVGILAAIAFFPLLSAAGSRLSVSSACSPGEKWRFDATVAADARAEFDAFLAGKSSPTRAFAEALAYRRDTPNGAPRTFSEYWIARSLFSAGIDTAAYQGFSAIVLQRLDEESTGVQFAALECVNELREKHPAFELPDGLADRLREMSNQVTSDREQQALWHSALTVLKQQLEHRAPSEAVRKTLGVLKGSGGLESFALGLTFAAKGDQPATVLHLGRFLSSQAGATTKVPVLERHLDQARLLVGRAYFNQKKYDLAGQYLKAIRKSSNDLPEALSELAWTSLMSRNYGESIGSALNLQAGGLRRTFAPEASMVLAIAMNELCQFPESLRAIDQFKRMYAPSYRWLSEWQQRGAPSEELHPAAIAYTLKKSKVADRVASEWIRSPLFHAYQDQLNLVHDEATSLAKLGRGGASEQRAMGGEIRRESQPIIQALRRSKGKPLSAAVKKDLTNVLEKVIHYRRYRAAAPAWNALATSQEARKGEKRRFAVEKINRELASLNRRMLGMLDEIAENNRMIEVEIYDGASNDIIWQNAHPDYKEVAKNFRDERKPAASKVWNWGHAPIGSDAWTEIWEDELGSFKSSLFDNCSSKDRYLALKKQKARADG